MFNWKRPGYVVDILLVLGVVATGWRIGTFLRSTPAPWKSPIIAIKPGVALALPGVQWSASPKSIVLVLDTSCKACIDSLPFYRSLADEVSSHSDFRLLVVSPEGSSEVRKWLEANGIRSNGLIQTDAGSLGVSVFPTLLFVDVRGTVTDVMSYKLSVAEQELVRARLRGASERPVNNTGVERVISEAELGRLPDTGRAQVLDIRPRREYDLDHRPGATNIPRDELEVRASTELGPALPLVIDCRAGSELGCQAAARLLKSLGFDNLSLLKAKK